MVTIDDFWDTQKILEEFDRDAITPVMGSRTLEEPLVELTPKQIATKMLEPTVGTKLCYICNYQTNNQLITSKHPVCVNCMLEHILD